VLVREEAIVAAWTALLEERIELRDFRVWLAGFEVLERRTGIRAERTPRYLDGEFRRLVGGVGGEHIRASFRRLENAGLGRWDEDALEVSGSRSSGGANGGRWVPIPRRMLRHLAQARGRAYIATALGHLLRCLYFRGGGCVSGGYCKASWISETFGVALRAVKEARGTLAAMGFLVLLQADQRRLNRFGSPVVVNLQWSSPTKSAPRCELSTSESAPPREHKNLSYRRVEHQKPGRAPDPAGVQKNNSKPNLRNVCVQDLRSSTRLLLLLQQAERAKLATPCEADRLAFFAAAEHAIRIGTRNAGGLFASMVRGKNYLYVTQEDEDRARRRLADWMEGTPDECASGGGLRSDLPIWTSAFGPEAAIGGGALLEGGHSCLCG